MFHIISKKNSEKIEIYFTVNILSSRFYHLLFSESCRHAKNIKIWNSIQDNLLSVNYCFLLDSCILNLDYLLLTFKIKML